VSSWLSCVPNPINCLTSSSLSGLGGSLISALDQWVRGDTTQIFLYTGKALAATTSGDIINQAVRHEYLQVMKVAPFLALIAIGGATLTALWRNEGTTVVRTFVMFVPLGIVLCALGPSLGTLLLSVADGLSSAVSTDVSAQLHALTTELSSGPGTFSSFAITGLCLLAAMLLWVELMVRTVMLTLMLCCLPLVAAGLVYAPARRVTVRLIESFAAVALSKVVVTLALSLGLAAMTTGHGAAAVVGLATLLLAGLAPYVVLRFIPLLDASVVHATDSLRQRAVRATAGSIDHPAVRVASSLLPSMEPPSPSPPEDLGFPMWPGIPEQPMPPVHEGPRPAPPIIPPPVRRGHMVVKRDRMGPVLGWEWDDD